MAKQPDMSQMLRQVQQMQPDMAKAQDQLKPSPWRPAPVGGW